MLHTQEWIDSPRCNTECGLVLRDRATARLERICANTSLVVFEIRAKIILFLLADFSFCVAGLVDVTIHRRQAAMQKCGIELRRLGLYIENNAALRQSGACVFETLYTKPQIRCSMSRKACS